MSRERLVKNNRSEVAALEILGSFFKSAFFCQTLTTHGISGPYPDPNTGNAGALYIGSGLSANGTRNNIYLYNLNCSSGLCNVPSINLLADSTVFGGSWGPLSDVRLKEDIQDLPEVLQKLKSIRSVTFRWANKNRPQDKQTGVVAQEVEKVFPEFVKEVDNLVQGEGSEPARVKMVDYQQLTAVALQGVKELSDKVDELERRLAVIEKKLEKPN